MRGERFCAFARKVNNQVLMFRPDVSTSPQINAPYDKRGDSAQLYCRFKLFNANADDFLEVEVFGTKLE